MSASPNTLPEAHLDASAVVRQSLNFSRSNTATEVGQIIDALFLVVEEGATLSTSLSAKRDTLTRASMGSCVSIVTLAQVCTLEDVCIK